MDYRKYRMNMKEKILGFLIGFSISFVASFLFFKNPLVSIVVGILSGIPAVFIFKKVLLKRRNKALLLQFKDLLESLSSSYSSGKNTRKAFEDSLEDMKVIYTENAEIVNEIKAILLGLNNNKTIESLLSDFGERSGLEDIQNFADVFNVCNRRGGNLREAVADAREIIGKKIEMEMSLEQMLSPGRNELNLLMAMPFIIVLLFNGDSMFSMSGNAMQYVLIKLVCIGIFVVSYLMGRKIMDIKV